MRCRCRKSREHGTGSLRLNRLMTPPVIELDALEVRFGTRTILKKLKASLSGRSIGLLGPNGAGKSTLLNTLLGLGQVRPWVTWQKTSQVDLRPQIAYCGPSLLANLALQLCLRVSRVDAFVVCTHCQKQYIPPGRAPKAGQRNFCPACRKQAIPKKYALQDFRERRRRSADAKKARIVQY